MYDELIKALRCKGLAFEECKDNGCKYFKNGDCDFLRLEQDAADIIEAMITVLDLE